MGVAADTQSGILQGIGQVDCRFRYKFFDCLPHFLPFRSNDADKSAQSDIARTVSHRAGYSLTDPLRPPQQSTSLSARTLERGLTQQGSPQPSLSTLAWMSS